MEYFDVAQICLNGHIINSRARTYPEENQKFCIKCGKETIRACSKCKENIRGFNPLAEGKFVLSLPSFCHECGSPYPWTESKASVIKEIVDMSEELSDSDKELFKSSIPDIMTENPRTEISALNIKKWLKKIGKDAAPHLRSLVIDIASETAKKLIQEQSKI
jgi:hypothetical protein